MGPIDYTVTLATADDDGIAQNQTPSGAGDFTLNGALVTGGVATLDSNGHARQVLLTSAANESGRTITVYGTVQANGNVVSEAVTGPNLTATTVNHFITVTRIAIDGAASGNIKIGTNGVGSSLWKPMDRKSNPFNVGMGFVVTGTANYSAQHTFDDIFNLDVKPVAFTHATATGKSANFDANYSYSVRAIRTLINSGATSTSSVRSTLLQSDNGG